MNAIGKIVTLQLGLFLSFGIGVASLFPNCLIQAIVGISICLIYALLSLFLLYRNATLRLGLRSMLFFCTFLIGYTLYLLHLPQNIPNHIENISKEGEQELLHIKILENRRSTSYYNQFLATVKQLNEKQTSGKVLMRIPRRDSIEKFEPGQEIVLYTKIQPLAKPVNPFDVDMRK